MKAFTDRFNYLFRSTKGLILVAIALIALVTAVLGMLSGPLKEWGISDVAVQLYGMRLVEAEREGRIILLYHTIAMAVVAIETYLITALVRMKPQQQANINATITVGYITSLIFGLAFGYFGHNYVFHGLFIAGQALVFFAGLQLAAALWPWRASITSLTPNTRTPSGGVSVERIAFFTMAAATLGSVLFGAVPGSLFGQGFETFLAEDIIRYPGQDAAAIGDHRPSAHHADVDRHRLDADPGPLVRLQGPPAQDRHAADDRRHADHHGRRVGGGAVRADRPHDHQCRLLPCAAGVMVAGLLRVAQDRARTPGASLASTAARFGKKLAALLHDPLKFGMLWQMIFMNFVVTAIGIFMAIRLKTIRALAAARGADRADRPLAHPGWDHRHDHSAALRRHGRAEG